MGASANSVSSPGVSTGCTATFTQLANVRETPQRGKATGVLKKTRLGYTDTLALLEGHIRSEFASNIHFERINDA